MNRIRVASLQYFIRPVKTFNEFRDQIVGLVETAADYGCQLLVFPEYFTVQLLTLGNVKRPMPEQIRSLADQVPAFLDLMRGLATEHRIYLAAGTIPMLEPETGAMQNVCHLFGPSGRSGTQGKLHMTRYEAEDWGISPSTGLTLFETPFGRLAVAICYDVEFPELSRVAARAGCHLLLVPSCTDDRQGFLRVRYCAHARAIENQMYVVCSSTVGSLPNVPAVCLNYGQAAILTPSDFAFARDGILAEGIPNQETMIIGDLNLETISTARASGTVLPLIDSQRTADVVARTRLLEL